jgi:hypothetical protein
MFERIISVWLLLLSFAWMAMTVALVFVVYDMTPRIDAAIEAVAIIEDAAQNIDDDMQILRNIADEQQCYENRGEWTTSHGCVLEEVQ